MSKYFNGNNTGDLNLVRKLEAEMLGFYGSYSATYSHIFGNKRDIIQAMDSSICREKLDAEKDCAEKQVDKNSACNEESTISNDINDTGMACSVKTLSRKYNITAYMIRKAVRKGELHNITGKSNRHLIYENEIIRYLEYHPDAKTRKKKKKGKANLK